MSLYGAIEVSSQGLRVQRQRMMLVSSNLANISTTATPEGGPYRRRQLVVEATPRGPFSNTFGEIVENQEEENASGVRSTRVALDPAPFLMRHEPGNPNADANGYVAYPNVNPAIEMVDMVGISRTYEANTNAIRTVRGMIEDAMEMLRS